jgi:protocatechuate 3,4-dioxygenase beta subunit
MALLIVLALLATGAEAQGIAVSGRVVGVDGLPVAQAVV